MALLWVAAAITLIVLVIVFGFFSAADRAVLFGSHKEFKSGGITREYLLHMPKQVTAGTQLVVGLHGFSGNAKRFAFYTALHNASDNTIFVYPEAISDSSNGIKSGWNAGFCCGAGWQADIDDVAFISELTESIAAEHGITKNNRFLTGFSNGAFMTHRIAAEAPGVFAAYAPISGTIGTRDNMLVPKEPVRLYATHGAKDSVIPIAGGREGSDPDFDWVGFADTVKVWQEAGADIAFEEYADDRHRWHDIRLERIWNTLPQGSSDVTQFFNGN